nr:ribonuclease H-like domain-containing protein [Tanacetum cinerariifolium]
VTHALDNESWVEAMQEELLQFKLPNVWTLMDLPHGKRAIGTKWVFRNKRDQRGIVVRNKARLVTQCHRQEEGIDYNEVFASVARIEAIILFLAYASFMDFTVYQMDVKSVFLYGTIEDKEMYDSWKSIMEQYMLNRQHGRMILESVENGPLIWPSIKENRVTIPKKYSGLSHTKSIQADCNIKTTKIILQGLPPEFQVNIKFLNTLPPEWSKFMIDVKLVWDLLTTNIDQLHAYLGQYEFHANEVRLMHERNSDPLTLVATHQMTQSPYQTHQHSFNQQPEFSQPDSGLIVMVFQKGGDPIDALNHTMSFYTAIVTSQYPTTNNQLRNSLNPRQQAPTNNLRVTLQPIPGRQTSLAIGHMSKQCTKPKRKRDDSWYKDKVLLTVITHNVAYQANDLDAYDSDCDKINTAKVTFMENLFHYRSDDLAEVHNHDNVNHNVINQAVQKAQQLEPKLYDGNVIKKTNAIVIRDSKETLMLAEESRSKMLLKQKDHKMSEKKVNTTPVDYNSVNFPEPTPSSRPTKVEVPKELPKVSMVNTSLKKLKHHLASFDMVVKERTTSTAITEGMWGFEHTKACFKDEIIPFVKALKDLFNSFDQFLVDELSKVKNVFHQMKQAVEQHRVESKTFESDNHDLCVLNFINNANARVKSKSVKKTLKRKVWKPTGKVFTNIGYIWRPTSRTFTMVGNACHLTRITTTTKVPLRIPFALESNTPKPVVVQIILWYLDSGCSKHMTGDRSQLTNFVNKFIDLEVAFRQHTCFILNLEGVDLLTGSQGNNLYTLSLGDMMASSPICLLSKAAKTKSWLWHRRLSQLNFGAINHLARQGLVRGLPRLNFEKDHLCSTCAMGKSKKKSHKPKSEDTNQEKLYLLHMDLYGPMRVESVNGKKYILVIVDDYSRFAGSKAVATACYTQNRSIVHLRHGKTPYELLHNKLPDLSFFHVFGSLCYPTNDSENLGKLQPKADIVTPEPAARSPSNSQSTPKTQPPIFPNDVEEDNHDIEVANIGFVDPEFLYRVYKVEKLYMVFTKLLEPDDIIFGSTKKSLSTEFEQPMHKRFQMSSVGELTFFLRLVKSASTLMETHKPLSKDANGNDTKIHVDNESAIYVVKNPVYHSKTKHIEIRRQFIRDSYEKRLIKMMNIHTDYNVVDLLTKAFDHNMVAYLEKIDDNTEFHYIVDFLSSCSINYALTGMDTCSSPRYQETIGGTPVQTRFERVLKQPNELPLSEGHTSRSREGRMKQPSELKDIVPPIPYDLPLTGALSNKVTTLENELLSTKAVYHKAFITLTKRVKKLETQLKQKRSRTVIHSTDEEEPSLDAEDSPKQRRMIGEIDKDETINLLSLDEELAQKLHAKELAKEIARQEQERVFSKAEVRKNMCTYLKNQRGYKKSYFKEMKYEDIRPIFKRKQKLDEQTEEEVEAQADTDQEIEEMKLYVKIIPDKNIAIDDIPLATKPPVIVEYKIVKEGKISTYHNIKADGSTKRYTLMIKLLKNIDRGDLETLWKLVKDKHRNTRPEEDYERVL